jgi:hypothetical protein
MPKKNPFEVLGLNRSIVRTLSDDQLADMVQGNYRRLARFYHPDRNKAKDAERKFKEAAEAYASLEDQKSEVFQLHTKAYLRKRPFQAQVQELEVQLTDVQGDLDTLVTQFTNYLIGSAGFEREQTIDAIQPCTLMLVDSVLQRMSPHHYKKQDSEKMFFNYQVDDQGVITRIDHKGEVLQHDKRIIGTISESDANEQGSIWVILHYAHSFPAESSMFAGQMIESGGIRFYDDRDKISRRIEPYIFSTALQFLKPQIRENSYLFTLNKDENGIYFCFEGSLFKIEEH